MVTFVIKVRNDFGAYWIMWDSTRTLWGDHCETLEAVKDRWQRWHGPYGKIENLDGPHSLEVALHEMRRVQHRLRGLPLDGRSAAAGERDEGRADA